MIILKHNGKNKSNEQCIKCEDCPCHWPTASIGFTNHQSPLVYGIHVHHPSGNNHTQRCTQAVGHHHEQSLSRVAYADVRFLVNEQRTTDIEEIERNAVNYHAKDKKPNACTWITESKEAKAKCP